MSKHFSKNILRHPLKFISVNLWVIMLIVLSLLLSISPILGVKVQQVTNTTEFGGPYFPIYGVYCGLYHTSYYGKEPIDEQDRYCQFHDICVTLEDQGLSSCWCNEQLYYLTSNLKPKNEELAGIKESILYYLYIAMARCENFYHFGTNIKITKVRDNSDTKGFNYLPFYPLHENKKESYIMHVNKTFPNTTNLDDLVLVYKMDMAKYQQFGKDVYDNPIDGVDKYTKYIIKMVIYEPFVFNLTNDDNVVVIYNPFKKFDKTIHVEKVKLCNTCHSNNDSYSINGDNGQKTIGAMTAGLVIMGVFIFILTVLLIIVIVKYKKLVGNGYDLVLPP